jgi:hypothetical protein
LIPSIGGESTEPVRIGPAGNAALPSYALGAWLLTGEWPLARRLAAGAVSGFGVGLLVTATKMF